MDTKIVCVEKDHVLFRGPELNAGTFYSSLCIVGPVSVATALADRGNASTLEKLKAIWKALEDGIVKSKNDRDQYVPHTTDLQAVKNALAAWINLCIAVRKFGETGIIATWNNATFAPVGPEDANSTLIRAWVNETHAAIFGPTSSFD